MKTSIRTIILAVATILAAMSCQKEASSPETQGNVKTGETIQVNINASLGYLDSTDGTKATAKPVIRLEWDGTETVDAYCGTTKLNINSITVTPSENGLFAKLNGTITAPEVGQIITFVYSSGCTADGLTFNFSSQDANIPFVAYATFVYDGTALADKMVEFKFATSVMKIAATNLGGGTISNATISGINTEVTLTPDAGSETCGIAGSNKSKITKTAGIDASSDGTKAIITVGLVPDINKGRNITVSQTDYTNKGVITAATIKSGTSYTTPTSLFPCGTLGAGADAHDYVLIAGTKWATRNVGATADAGVGSYGKYFYWGDIVGQTWDGSIWSNGGFPEDPIYITNSKKLPLENDAAYKIWKDPWRMPTSTEFQALMDATYWKWDDGGGYYVYAPQSDDAGKINSDSGVTGTYDKNVAFLLYFPAAGYGFWQDFINYDGWYWSSTRSAVDEAYPLVFNSDGRDQTAAMTNNGFSIRPVSD